MRIFRDWHKKIMDYRRGKKAEWESLEVKARPECIFNYCPFPSQCGLRCQQPRNDRT